MGGRSKICPIARTGRRVVRLAHALGHLLSGGYRTNPLEEIAYDPQARFDRHDPPFDMAALVRHELDGIVPALRARANGLSRIFP